MAFIEYVESPEWQLDPDPLAALKVSGCKLKVSRTFNLQLSTFNQAR